MSPLDFVYIALIGALASALVSVGADRQPAVLRYANFGLLAISGAAAVVAGLWVLIGEAPVAAQLPLGLPWLPWHLRLDALSGLFLAVVGTLVFAISCTDPPTPATTCTARIVNR